MAESKSKSKDDAGQVAALAAVAAMREDFGVRSRACPWCRKAFEAMTEKAFNSALVLMRSGACCMVSTPTATDPEAEHCATHCSTMDGTGPCISKAEGGAA